MRFFITCDSDWEAKIDKVLDALCDTVKPGKLKREPAYPGETSPGNNMNIKK